MTEKEALQQAEKLCSKKEYASGEMIKKLLGWELTEESACQVMAILIKEKFIDDKRFARAFVNDKLKFSKWGRIKINFMLRQKGVADPVISESLASIDQEVYEEVLFSELKKKAKSIRADSDYEFKGKLVQFASGRGFEYELSARIAEKIKKNK